MLPIQLLRAKIRNRGKNIELIFCRHIADDTEGDSHYALHLSAKLIEEFEESWKSSERNGLLAERLTLLEEQYGDYKLVRGLYTLLQRRCIFGTKKNPAATVEATTSIANIVRHSTTSSNLDTTGHQS